MPIWKARLSHSAPATGATTQSRGHLARYAWPSLAAALATIGLKSAAYVLSGSVGH